MTIDLNAGWRMREAPIGWDEKKAGDVAATTSGWLETGLPCDAHMPLIASGVIRDPVKADYCHESEWLEDRSWWFMREFDSGELPDCDEAVLELDSLDACADIFLNGERVGYQASAHYPFALDIKAKIREGKNAILVRATAGLERVDSAAPGDLGWNVGVEGERRPDRGDMRRAFIRKPQYVFGWDWGPRAASIGIMKGARIACKTCVAVAGAHVSTRSIAGGTARLTAVVEVEALPKLSTIIGDVAIELLEGGRVAASAKKRGILLSPGKNFVEIGLDVEHAKLWWPNGMGGQPLYTVRIAAESGGIRFDYPEFRLGIRTVALDTSDTAGGRLFRLVVNGVSAMCKGGNWIPADSVYARVTDEKYLSLVREAQAANFSMLRIWGGGIYERDAFFDACDECGILLWHDFMFACSAYPDYDELFCREVEREIDYQTKRLRNHASLALWCGNNENQWLLGQAMARPGAHMGLKIYGEIAPGLVRKNCPEIPYWPSSPFGGAEPNAEDAGDRHIWNDFMMNEDMEKRITPEGYDEVKAMFVSEYGFPGPTVKESIEEYFDGRPIDREGTVWDLHTNTFEKNTVMAGIRKHYTDRVLGLDEYLLYASLVQAMMLEYSLEALRVKPECWGALFWMYNDCWGEVGWSIVDYYLRRKPSFYAVRRAFEPVRLVLRSSNGEAVIHGCNDTDRDVSIEADAGWFPMDGTAARTQRISLALPARGRGTALRLPLGAGNPQTELWAVRPAAGEPCPALLRLRPVRELALPESGLAILKAEASGSDLAVTVRAARYAHAVHFGPGYLSASDQYFDLLPGESRTVRILGMAGKAAAIEVKSMR